MNVFTYPGYDSSQSVLLKGPSLCSLDPIGGMSLSVDLVIVNIFLDIP